MSCAMDRELAMARGDLPCPGQRAAARMTQMSLALIAYSEWLAEQRRIAKVQISRSVSSGGPCGRCPWGKLSLA